MGKIMEAVFCVFYLVFTFIMSVKIIRKSQGRKEDRMFGIMTLVLVLGDAFHLVPRILAAIMPAADLHVSLGIGKMITSVTMTVFYVILYFILEMRYEKKMPLLKACFLVLALVRIVLCFLPQNDWIGEAPVIWGIYRNIPFLIMGLIMVILAFLECKDKYYRFLWLAILLSFGFYLPVVVWADVNPIIGMLMLPKTIMYMWIVVMGYRQVKAR